MERCQSGRMGHFRKVLNSQGFRGFESLPLCKVLKYSLWYNSKYLFNHLIIYMAKGNNAQNKDKKKKKKKAKK